MFQFHHHTQSSYYKAYGPTTSLTQKTQTQQQQYVTSLYNPMYPPLDPSQRRIGRVKFFNALKGYGFIIPISNTNDETFPGDDLYNSHKLINEEVFVHHTSIISMNRGCPAELNKGEEVEYDLRDGPKGIYALYVTGPKGSPLKCNAAYYNNTLLTAANIQQQHEYHSKSVYHPFHHHQQQQYITYFIPPPPPPPQLYHHHPIKNNANLIPYY